jgi:hypothetical protein
MYISSSEPVVGGEEKYLCLRQELNSGHQYIYSLKSTVYIHVYRERKKQS